MSRHEQNVDEDRLTHDFRESIEWHLGHGHRLIRLNKWTDSTKDCKAPFDKGWRKDKTGLTKRQAFNAVRAGHNIGWAPTGEHLIIDVDMHGSKNGIATYDKFRKLLPPEHTVPRVNSSRGGFHLYFRKSPDDEVTTRRLKEQFGSGVDVIANQQVVVPASIHPVTKLPYEFATLPRDIPFWPDELRDLLLRDPSQPQDSTNTDDLPDLRAVERLTFAIPNDDGDNDYDAWFAVGCAIHDSTGGSEEGLEIFKAWSEQNPLFDEDYTEKKWESMGRYDGPRARFGTLVERAREVDKQLVSNILHAVNTPTAAADFAHLPPPKKDFDINKDIKHAWHLVEETLDYRDIAPDEWYYRDVLPKGAYAVMAGRQGLGKSTLLMHLAACVTNGRPFPGDEDNPIKREPGDVIYFSVEERVRQSILPKLKQSGAHLNRFHAFRAGVSRVNRKGEEEVRGFSVNKGIHYLEEQLKKYPDTRMVIFDPITMFIVHENASDSNNAVSMNQSLAPLNKLAEDHDLCILGVTHFNKSGGRGLDKVTGSIAHTTVARHVTYLLPHYLDNHTVVATAKSNMFTDKTSYVFQGVELDPEFIEGYDTPLRKRELHLFERNTDGIDADQWESIVEDRTDGEERRSAQQDLASSISQHIADNSLQRMHWDTAGFKQYFKALFSHHDAVFETVINDMVRDNQLHRENVRGTWYIWPIDGLIVDDVDELEAFNESMRETIRNQRQPAYPIDVLCKSVQEYVYDEFPNAVSYNELKEKFPEIRDDKRRTKVLKRLESEGVIERFVINHVHGYAIANIQEDDILN